MLLYEHEIIVWFPVVSDKIASEWESIGRRKMMTMWQIVSLTIYCSLMCIQVCMTFIMEGFDRNCGFCDFSLQSHLCKCTLLFMHFVIVCMLACVCVCVRVWIDWSSHSAIVTSVEANVFPVNCHKHQITCVSMRTQSYETNTVHGKSILMMMAWKVSTKWTRQGKRLKYCRFETTTYHHYSDRFECEFASKRFSIYWRCFAETIESVCFCFCRYAHRHNISRRYTISQ